MKKKALITFVLAMMPGLTQYCAVADTDVYYDDALFRKYVDFPGLSLWLDASYGVTVDESDKVIRWADKYTRNNRKSDDAIPRSESEMPSYIASGINGRPTLRFDVSAIQVERDTAVWMRTGDLTAFIVFRSSRPDYISYESLLVQKDNKPEYAYTGYSAWIHPPGTILGNIAVSDIGSETVTGPNVRDGQTKIAMFEWDRDGMLNAYLNGDLADSTDISALSGYDIKAAAAYQLYIGHDRNRNYYFQGDISEIILYKRVLTAEERQSVMTYLNWKYVSSVPPVKCGDLGTLYDPMDLTGDCYVGFYDAVEFLSQWLECSDPAYPEACGIGY